MTLRPGDTVEIEIDSLAAGGDGVGRADGLVVFVPLTAPGDRVIAEIVRSHSRYARAEMRELITPGAGRRQPACPHFGVCGGCSWLHLSAKTQREARIALVMDALVRIARVEDPPNPEWIPSPLEIGYRSRARVSLGHDRIGFHMRRSDEIVDVSHCLVLDADTQAELGRLRDELPEAGPVQEREIQGFGERAHGLRVSEGSFFQANRSLWAIWQERVVRACGTGNVLLELYAGVGFYTQALVANFERVTAVERGVSAGDLRRNTSAEVFHGSAEAFADRRLAALKPDVVLLNPPRNGCDARVVAAIQLAAPRRIVYVSCNPPTLARDVRAFGDAYHIAEVIVIDAMPQTHHVEAVVVLEQLTLHRARA